MEDKKLYVKYNEKSDLLNVSVGEEDEGIIVKVEENFYVKLSIETGEIIGYTICNYSENVHKNKHWSDKLLTIPEDMDCGSFYVKRRKTKKAA